MKNKFMITCVIAFISLIGFRAYAQNPSMTIQHSGLAPNDTLWVMPGDSIDFIYGGGGNHPMTSGQGATPSPVFFPTVTVNPSFPLATFTLTTVGTYTFHCGTNPGNTNNWGTIIVMNPTGLNEESTTNSLVSVFPNPSQDKLSIRLKNQVTAKYMITDNTGRKMTDGLIVNNLDIDISDFKSGVYHLRLEFGSETIVKSFVKQ